MSTCIRSNREYRAWEPLSAGYIDGIYRQFATCIRRDMQHRASDGLSAGYMNIGVNLQQKHPQRASADVFVYTELI